MHPLGARVISRRNELLCVLASVHLLVVHLLEWAHGGHVAVLNVKSPRETHILIVVPFVHIGEIWFAILLLWGWYLCCASFMRDELARHRLHGSRGLHVVCKGVTTPSASSACPALTALMSPTSCVEVTHRKVLLHGYGHLLDGWHLERVAQHIMASVLSRGLCKQHCRYLQHDGHLVCHQLCDCSGNVCIDGWLNMGGSARGGCTGRCLSDGGDRILVVVIVAFQHVVHVLGGVPILPLLAAQCHCCEALPVRLMKEGLEGWVRLGG